MAWRQRWSHKGGIVTKVTTRDEYLDATCGDRGYEWRWGGLMEPYLGMISLSPDRKSPAQQDASHVVCETRISKLTRENGKV
ncbi:uncharacterized protein N7529_007223 [Penicillium soppii]|uniref:uncharacterized protein n=1 Tax=Penicillium soppii TaxID=69789 RepID=UPI0025483E19|nr:uncharacterized protein N7529_007223 [Penicillium soppii]KAJ5865307.1 hypothetical protein N7529_007223 [Penicillium soppii]